MRRRWTEAERETLRCSYATVAASELAMRLDRSVSSVYQEALKLGLQKVQHVKTGLAFRAELRRLHALGFSDAEAAGELGCERHTVGDWRRRLGLCSNARSERVRAKVRATTARQVAEAGVASLGEIRALAFRQFAAESGWPEDLRPRAVQILDLLAIRGPMTRREIAEAIGMPWKGSRKSLTSNDAEGSYLAHLMARGLVVSLGRVVRGVGSGKSVQLYSLALTAERSVGDGIATETG